MKKILITGANSSKAYQLAHFINNKEIIFADSVFQNFLIPDENRSSYAHELLSLCLNNNIEEIFPLRIKELKALAEAKVLFKEYDIEICIPSLLDLHKLNNLNDIGYDGAENYTIVSSYQELSSNLLSLGYPNKKFLIGRLDDEGELLTLDDEQTNFNSVWNGLKSVSFLQIGKLFNNKEFEPLKIYDVEGELIKVDVLAYENQVFVIQNLDESTLQIIQSLITHLKLNGFFEVVISADKVLRIRVNTI